LKGNDNNNVAYFSTGLIDNVDLVRSENNPNIANITMLESVQLRHSETETNLTSKYQYQPLPIRLHQNSLYNYFSLTDREMQQKSLP
jgi:hypothetical protein